MIQKIKLLSFLTFLSIIFVACGGESDDGINHSPKHGGEFTKEGETIIDQSRHLQWQDDSEVVLRPYIFRQNCDENQDCSDTAEMYCKNLKLGGYYDWRLPSTYELLYVHNVANNSNFHHKKHKEDNTHHNLKHKYWTKDGHCVGFDGEYHHIDDKSSINYVRCVRDMDQL